MISEMKSDSIFQVLQYDSLEGGADSESAVKLKYMKDAGIRLKQIRIILDESAVYIEPGRLSYMKGNIVVSNKVGGVVGLGKKIFTGKVTGEAVFKPYYQGTGEVFLEPSFGNFALIELEDDEIIVDDGLFLACEETVKIGASRIKRASAVAWADEGLFQVKLSGSGIVVLEIPVPEKEIFKCTLINDTLKVDGNFVILRSGEIDFTVEKAAKSIISSITSREGFVNVYRGTGQVWLIPTKSVYDRLVMKNPEYKTESEDEEDEDH